MQDFINLIKNSPGGSTKKTGGGKGGLVELVEPPLESFPLDPPCTATWVTWWWSAFATIAMSLNR